MLPITSAETLLKSLIQNGCYVKHPSMTLTEWYRLTRKDGVNEVAPELQSLYGGFFANSVGQAFINGYETAIQRLLKEDTSEYFAAVCVTENKSTRPRDMNTALSFDPVSGWMLSGQKDFVTLATDAKTLFVAAKRECDVAAPDRNDVVMLRVPVSLPGVSVQPLPDLPFVPDVSHGSVVFDRVLVSQDHVLEGDGYSRYVKPFRWFEDVEVSISIASYLFKVAMAFDWRVESKVEMLSLLSALNHLQKMDAADEISHVVMHDQLSRMDNWILRYQDEWKKVPEPIMGAWKRDRLILTIAKKARHARYKRAQASLFG